MDMILEIAKYTIPAVVVLFTAILLSRSFLRMEERKRAFELRIINQKAALPVRLQAYERIALFLERIAPNNLIQRVRRRGMSAADLHLALIQDVRKEYEHNLSQQIYISPEAWMIVSTAKEEMITILNRVAANLPINTAEKDLTKGIFEFFLDERNQMPTQKALLFIKQEVKKIY